MILLVLRTSKVPVDEKRLLVHLLLADFHIQNINAYQSRLKIWMVHFHGVAAKNFINYLGWRRMLEWYTKHIQPEFWLQEAVSAPCNS